MRIFKKDIIDMVCEAVSALLNESQHALDDGLYNLALAVVNRTVGKGIYCNLSISPETLNRFMPERYMSRILGDYSISDMDNLNIKFVDSTEDGTDGSYEYVTNTIYLKKFTNDFGNLNPKQLNAIKKRTVVALSHELSHFIDNNAQNRYVHNVNFDKGSFPEIVKSYLYCFNPSEIQARLNQYDTMLRVYPSLRNKSITGSIKVEKALMINTMKGLIDNLETLEYEGQFKNKQNNPNDITSWIIVYLDYFKRFNDRQRKRYDNPDSEYDSVEYVSYLKHMMPIGDVKPLDKLHFERAKAYFLKDYSNKYSDMLKRAKKIQYKWLSKGEKNSNIQ